MTTFFISRHPGAVEWAGKQQLSVDQQIPHLDEKILRPGDLVIGCLPIHMVESINRKGVRYGHLSLDIPAQWRGKELTLEQMYSCNPRLEWYEVRKNGLWRSE